MVIARWKKKLYRQCVSSFIQSYVLNDFEDLTVKDLVLCLWCMQNCISYQVNCLLTPSWLEASSARWLKSCEATNNDHFHLLSIDERQLLTSSGQLRRLLSRHAVEYIALGDTFWEPTEIRNDAQIMSRVRNLRTLATYDNKEQLTEQLVGSSVQLHCLSYG
jgi:hypothetical protein